MTVLLIWMRNVTNTNTLINSDQLITIDQQRTTTITLKKKKKIQLACFRNFCLMRHNSDVLTHPRITGGL